MRNINGVRVGQAAHLATTGMHQRLGLSSAQHDLGMMRPGGSAKAQITTHPLVMLLRFLQGWRVAVT
jgi:hypothetical protein